MNHKRKTMLAQSGAMYPAAFSVIFFGDNPAVISGAIGIAFPCLVWMMTLYIKGDPEAARQREKDLMRQRIEELENDLDLEPLNLHELDPVFDEIEKEKPNE